MKKGAASFYIVAFSTLILMIIATSFAMVIISEITRSANDDLSQSAYDSALAGVEDAKVAYSNYRRCKEAQASNPNIRASYSGSDSVTCNNILYWVEEEKSCQMVAKILGRPQGPNGEVELGGTEVGNGGKVTTTNQAYTCVMINTKLDDYKATLNQNNKVQTIKAAVGDGPTNNVNKIKISWYTVRADVRERYRNFVESGTNSNKVWKVNFPSIASDSIATPPTLEVQILQTGTSFYLSDFNKSVNDTTNRATLYLVPTNQESKARSDGTNYYHTSAGNVIDKGQVARTNSHTVVNMPYVVYCDSGGEFYCTAEIQLPEPIGGGSRNNDTFMISVALPYQQPDTDFSIELYCSDGSTCGRENGSTSSGDKGMLKNTQISIDSTGRANDLFRRVETRLETSDTTYASGYPYYALEILGNDKAEKNMTVYYEVPQFYF